MTPGGPTGCYGHPARLSSRGWHNTQPPSTWPRTATAGHGRRRPGLGPHRVLFERLHGHPGHLMGGAWPQGGPRAGGLRRGPGGRRRVGLALARDRNCFGAHPLFSPGNCQGEEWGLPLAPLRPGATRSRGPPLRFKELGIAVTCRDLLAFYNLHLRPGAASGAVWAPARPSREPGGRCMAPGGA